MPVHPRLETWIRHSHLNIIAHGQIERFPKVVMVIDINHTPDFVVGVTTPKLILSRFSIARWTTERGSRPSPSIRHVATFTDVARKKVTNREKVLVLGDLPLTYYEY